MLRTLYAKLSLVLLLLLLGIGLLYALISSSLTKHYLQQVNQQFNRDLASKLVADRNLVAEGRLHEPALRETFRQYMVINPSIEIYLLDLDGTILSYSADPGKVKRKSVSLEPIRAFLQGRGEYPLLGDDPRSHDRHKAFSVTPVPSTEHPRGYLYVVLRGEEFEAVEEVIRDSYFSRLSAWALAGSLGFGLLAGLLIFHLLTRRLHRLSADMDDFQHSNFTAHTPYTSQPCSAPDEVDRLGLAFDQMANRISAQLDLLRDQDRLRRTLVAQVSHDLRTPLTRLRTRLEMLQSAAGEDLDGAGVAECIAESDQLLQTFNALLRIARIESHGPRKSASVALDQIAGDVVDMYQAVAEEKNVALEADVVPVTVAGDRDLLFQALVNLVDNGIKYTPPGGSVTLAVAVDGDDCCVEVRDTGPGIADAHKEKVTRRFYRIDGARGEKGNGLGLSLVAAVAQRHDALLEFADANPGLVVRLCLPCAVQSAPTNRAH